MDSNSNRLVNKLFYAILVVIILQTALFIIFESISTKRLEAILSYLQEQQCIEYQEDHTLEFAHITDEEMDELARANKITIL